VNPQVEAALRKFISTPEVSETFHDPEVHNALMDIRTDLKNISKYRDNPRVIQVGVGVRGWHNEEEFCLSAVTLS
jgi:hypothetical protein